MTLSKKQVLLAVVLLAVTIANIGEAGSAPKHRRCVSTTLMSAAAVPTDIPDAILRDLRPPFYGGADLFVGKPTFYRRGKGAFAYLSVWKSDDLELRGSASLPGTGHIGRFAIQKGAALRGLQRVPVELPRRGCWRITISTERAKVSFNTKV